MDGFYIFLGIMGIICVILSFMLSEKLEEHKSGQDLNMSDEELQVLLTNNQKALENALTVHAKKAKEAAMEETERELARLTNEKIMAVDEFSDTVLEKINQNHSEVIFLYNMLNEKEKELKDLLADINKTAKDGRESIATKSEVSVDEKVKSKKVSERKNNQRKPVGKQNRKEPDLSLSEQEKKQEASTRDQIISLHEKGISVTDIAKQLKIGKGEVKLIIDLYQGAQ